MSEAVSSTKLDDFYGSSTVRPVPVSGAPDPDGKSADNAGMTSDLDAVPDPMPAAAAARPAVPRVIRPARAKATIPPPLSGPWAPDDRRIDECVRYPLPSGAGPEDVVIDPAG